MHRPRCVFFGLVSLALVASTIVGVAHAALVASGDSAAVPLLLPPPRRFYVSQYNAAGYPQYPNCSVATFTNVQSAAFRDQYNADGFLYRLGAVENWLACNVAVLPHRGSQSPASLAYEHGTITLWGRDGNQLCNGPYNATMQLGVSSDNSYNAAVFGNFTQSIQEAMLPTGSFNCHGSTAIMDCATQPAPTPPPSTSTFFFIAAYEPAGYPAVGYPTCQVATLDQFQSDDFRQQYNVGGDAFGGGINALKDNLPPSMSCQLTVVPYPGGAPGSLTFEHGDIVPFGMNTGTDLCNGPYNTTMRLGTTSNNQYNPMEFSTLTPGIQNQAGIGAFSYSGSLALVACGLTPVPTPSPLPASRRFRIASYDSSGYPSEPSCRLATLDAFKSDAFRKQYNADGTLPFQGPISNWVSCTLAILPTPGGQIASLGWEHGSIVPFSNVTGQELCNGPYEAAMKIGASSDNQYNSAIFVAITQGMQNAASAGTFVYTGSLALLDCDPATTTPTPAPPPVARHRFALGAYQPSGRYANNCTLATFEAFQSPDFRLQYNLEHALDRFGVVPNSFACDVAVAQYVGGPPAILSFEHGSIVAFGRDGAVLCNGPYNSTMKIGTSSNNNYDAALFDSITSALQQQTGIGTFSNNETLALTDCGNADGNV